MPTFNVLWLFICFGFCRTSAQIDSVHVNQKFHYSQLILPSALISYGVVGLQSDELQKINRNVRDEIKGFITTDADDVLVAAPALAVYGLNAAGIKGRHDFRDRTVIIITSAIFTYSTVLGLKGATGVFRPDGSTSDSFPSGHTATAFAGAEFLHQEYKHKSVWYGIAGYTVATFSGFLRMSNDRHWLTDVAAGAGIGILGTKAAYYIQPTISELIFSGDDEKHDKTIFIYPIHDRSSTGIGIAIGF